jgi:hypothetical protein
MKFSIISLFSFINFNNLKDISASWIYCSNFQSFFSTKKYGLGKSDFTFHSVILFQFFFLPDHVQIEIILFVDYLKKSYFFVFLFPDLKLVSWTIVPALCRTFASSHFDENKTPDVFQL